MAKAVARAGRVASWALVVRERNTWSCAHSASPVGRDTDRGAIQMKGVKLAPERLLLELTLRGISQAEFSRRAQLSESTVSAAAQGRPVSPATFRNIAATLAQLPILEGASALLAWNDSHSNDEAAEAPKSSAAKEVRRVGADLSS
jgi:transcriptional regulator with XRE-family HTH domain